MAERPLPPCGCPTLAKARTSIRVPALSPAQRVHRLPLPLPWTQWGRVPQILSIFNSGHSGTLARWAPPWYCPFSTESQVLGGLRGVGSRAGAWGLWACFPITLLMQIL